MSIVKNRAGAKGGQGGLGGLAPLGAGPVLNNPALALLLAPALLLTNTLYKTSAIAWRDEQTLHRNGDKDRGYLHSDWRDCSFIAEP